jgi:hypothetical protein
MQTTGPQSHDPYRDVEGASSFAFLPEESSLLIECGRWMALAGMLGCIDVAVSSWTAIRDTDATAFIGIAFMATFAAFTLEAGLVLRRLRGEAASDYRSIAKALGRLHIVFAIKGVLFLALIAVTGMAFVLPLLLHFFR